MTKAITKSAPGRAPELLSRMERMLAEARTIQELLHVRGMAGGYQRLFKAALKSRTFANRAAAIRIQAETKAGGELVRQAQAGERAIRGSGGGGRAKSHDVTLPDLGITKMQSSRWQELWHLPEALRTKYIELYQESDSVELTTKGLLNFVRLQLRAEQGELIRQQPLPPPEGPFDVIVIDPPWRYGARADDATHRGRTPYPDMSLEEINKIGIPDIAAENCILWLWTTNAFLREAFTCLDAWKFEYKTTLTWVKDRFGLGDWLRGQTEHCLMAVQGHPVRTLTNQSTALSAPMREHSRKPDEFYALVDALCPGGKLDYFGREEREGWIVWGNETGKF